jgi:hypothetical protein
VHVTLIDRRNYHLFQPLLYQVATAGLSPADIAMPIRSILSRQRNAIVVLARVVAINTATRIVSTDAREIPYDILIVATGARHAYFGHDEWKSVALGLKKIEDATGIRRQILLSFELAESIGHPAERRRLLNFVIVGRRANGRRAGGGNRGARAQGARLRLPPHRSAPGPCNPNRGGTSATCHVSRETRSGGSASPAASWRRSPRWPARHAMRCLRSGDRG